MKSRVALIFIIMSVISTPVFSSCKSDLKKVAVFTKKAEYAKQQGNSNEARGHYKRAARKLSAMKYTCSEISLDELAKKERHYRALATGLSSSSNVTSAAKPKVAPQKPDCGTDIPRARQLVSRGGQAKGRQSKAHYAKARTILNSIKRKCPRSKAASTANNLLARIAAENKAKGEQAQLNRKKTIKKASSKPVKSSQTRTSASRIQKPRKPRVARSKKHRRQKGSRITGRYPGRKSCEINKLVHFYTAEQQAYSALKDLKYSLAADRFVDAIHGYENNSHKCLTAKAKLSVLDRAEHLKAVLNKLKREHIHCSRHLDEVRELAKLAYNDEHAGEFELAQEGYVKAVKAYESIPQVCASLTHSTELNENRAKRDLLACSHYIDGIKQYNKAFKAVSNARNRQAANAYQKAAASFDLALGNCKYNTVNNKVLRKLTLYSKRYITRLRKR